MVVLAHERSSHVGCLRAPVIEGLPGGCVVLKRRVQRAATQAQGPGCRVRQENDVAALQVVELLAYVAAVPLVVVVQRLVWV
jgi:hypothetical protein